MAMAWKDSQLLASPDAAKKGKTVDLRMHTPSNGWLENPFPLIISTLKSRLQANR